VLLVLGVLQRVRVGGQADVVRIPRHRVERVVALAIGGAREETPVVVGVGPLVALGIGSTGQQTAGVVPTAVVGIGREAPAGAAELGHIAARVVDEGRPRALIALDARERAARVGEGQAVAPRVRDGLDLVVVPEADGERLAVDAGAQEQAVDIEHKAVPRVDGRERVLFLTAVVRQHARDAAVPDVILVVLPSGEARVAPRSGNHGLQEVVVGLALCARPTRIEGLIAARLRQQEAPVEVPPRAAAHVAADGPAKVLQAN